MSDYRAEIIEKAGAGPTINSLHSNRPLGGEKKKQPFSVRYTNRKSIRKSRFALSIKKVIQHPIGQAFHRNHKKFEPLVANAFLAVCNKIKSGIDLAELAKVVETRDLYRVIEMVAGDKFEKGLNGEFKKLIFEAYHAGALIGASQLKNAPVKKGGPGSGPHTTTGADRFKQILAYQRALENNKPALKHDISGEIVPAEGDEMHLDILDRIGGDARDWQEGFLTRDGRFVSRDQAESQLGFRTLAFKSFSGSLDLQNEDAVDYLRTELPTLIKEINNQQALAVQAVLLQGIHGGMDGPAIARQLKQVVGLTEKQAQWVINFRTQLMTGVNGNFTPVDERRLSAVDASMAQDQFEALEKDPATVDLLVDKYAASLTAKRAMDIAVSEIHSAEIQGQQEIWNKAVDLGYLDPDITRRMWGGIHDGKEREDHIATEDMNPDGVRIDEPFQTPIGEVMNPGDSGDDGFDDNCRCFVSLQFLDAWGKGAPNNEDQDSSTEEE